MNPTVVPITKMRDAILGESSNIPDYGYIMCFSLAIVTYALGSIIFERKAHRAVVNV
jgi:ABC-type polysaccharide/polyol phosphate export permease